MIDWPNFWLTIIKAILALLGLTAGGCAATPVATVNQANNLPANPVSTAPGLTAGTDLPAVALLATVALTLIVLVVLVVRRNGKPPPT